MKTVMISIRARHLRNIRKGLKTWELRTTKPVTNPPFRVVCCVVGTGGTVEAQWICDRVVDLRTGDIKNIARIACVTPEEVMGYRESGALFGWHIQDGSLRDFRKENIARHISDYRVNRVPRFWCYVRDDLGL